LGTALSAPQIVRDALLHLNPVEIFTSFGMTESPCISFLNCRENPERLHTAGQPSPKVQIRVEQDSTISISSPYTITSYWNNSELSKSKLESGWLRTGDCGLIDQDGYFVFLGRKDDLISCFGFHFFPAEIERAMSGILTPGQFCVVGVEDESFVGNQVPILFIESSAEKISSIKKELPIGFSRLSAHATPRDVVFLPSIPKLSNGKIDKPLLKKEYKRHVKRK
jgi:acyl-CoA synthetase (AMP-forming)/AMP-acid ligase II